MNLILITSILLRVAALLSSLHLAWRIRDMRVLLLSAMLALMVTRQAMTLASRGAAPASTEIPGLIVSVLALLAVYVLGRLLQEMEAKEQALASSEAHFRQLIESSIDAIVMLDFEGRILYANPAVTTQFGYSPEQLAGRVALDLVLDKDRAHVAAAFADGLAHPGSPRAADCRMVRMDGVLRDVEARGALVDAAGTEPHVLISLRDVSDQREAERARSALQAQLYQAQKMETLGRLAGGIAHDFNNILTPILGSAELARRRVADDAGVREHLERIIEATERARTLVQRMLLIGGKAQIAREPVDLADVAHETLELLRVSLPKRVEIHGELGERPCVVLADSLQLHQVLMNLCTNAARAMAGGGVLTVALTHNDVDALHGQRHPVLRAGQWARLRVSDTGTGIAPDVMAHMFEPFFTTGEAGEGSGLGLSVVEGIVEGHGGVIEVESVPAKGTHFDIYLRMTDQPLPRKSAPPVSVGAVGAGRIMLVDDELAVVTVGRELLEAQGFSVVAFTNPSLALERFERGPQDFAAVVTDYAMPVMTGLELAARVRQRAPALPVILTTGYAEAEVLERDARGNVAAVLTKPYHTEELISAIELALAASTPRG